MPFEDLYDGSPPETYLRALGAVGFPDQLAAAADMVSCISRIMDVMAGNGIGTASEQEMDRLVGRCEEWGYSALSSGPKDAVANALGELIWQTGARRLKAPPFGPFGSESIRKAKSCGIELKCQFITADNVGHSMTYSHVIAPKNASTWWFAGYCVHSSEPLRPSSATQKIRFRCPECSRPVSVALQYAGKRGKCPGCASVVRIPHVAAQDAEKTVSKTRTGQQRDLISMRFYLERQACRQQADRASAIMDDVLSNLKSPPGRRAEEIAANAFCDAFENFDRNLQRADEKAFNAIMNEFALTREELESIVSDQLEE